MRRNAPTIPTTHLPATGRPGPAPKPPAWVKIGPKGRAWWRWAWATPQAAAWSDGDLAFIAGRAQLEDEIATAEEPGMLLRFRKSMMEADDRLGLTPKGLAALRWKIVDDGADRAAAPVQDAGVSSLAERRQRLVGA
ncbi:MAG: hypothetical protein OEV62_00230 [Actinomycetota bacterium]|nr:hypothetical protein [Actinomycetota bacterium]